MTTNPQPSPAALRVAEAILDEFSAQRLVDFPGRAEVDAGVLAELIERETDVASVVALAEVAIAKLVDAISVLDPEKAIALRESFEAWKAA